jgi:hypothetical protein
MKIKFNPKRLATRKIFRGAGKATSGPASRGTINLNKFDEFIRVHKIEKINKAKFARKLQEDAQQHGTGSFIVDALGNVAGKVFGKDKVQNLFYKVQKPLQQADVALGKKLAKGPFKGFFTSQESRSIGKARVSGAGNVDVNVDVNIPRATAAFDKVKKFVMPSLATAYLYDKLRNKNLEEEEYNALKQGQEKEAKLKLQQEHEEKTAEYEERATKYAALVHKAEDALRKSASEIRRLNSEMESVFEANAQLRRYIVADKRSRRSTKLACDMLKAGMIKKADLDSEIEKIMELDDPQFEKLQTETTALLEKTSQHAEEGVSALSDILVLGMDEISKKGLDMRDSFIRVTEQLTRR